MRDVEIDIVVPSSIEALALYKQIFDIEIDRETKFDSESKEVFFKMYGVCFHLLDEDPEQSLFAPKKADSKPIWINVTVPNIEEVYTRAMDAESIEVQGITLLEAFGLRNAVFMDRLGYKWMLHQKNREVCFEDKSKTLGAT